MYVLVSGGRDWVVVVGRPVLCGRGTCASTGWGRKKVISESSSGLVEGKKARMKRQDRTGPKGVIAEKHRTWTGEASVWEGRRGDSSTGGEAGRMQVKLTGA